MRSPGKSTKLTSRSETKPMLSDEKRKEEKRKEKERRK
jgi:hypothetical protein